MLQVTVHHQYFLLGAWRYFRTFYGRFVIDGMIFIDSQIRTLKTFHGGCWRVKVRETCDHSCVYYMQIRVNFIVFPAATLWFQRGTVCEFVRCPTEAKWRRRHFHHGPSVGKVKSIIATTTICHAALATTRIYFFYYCSAPCVVFSSYKHRS